MEENNRVRNIKEKFEVLNFTSEPLVVNRKIGVHKTVVNNKSVALNNKELLTNKYVENSLKNCINIRSNIKRTPAFRRDKIALKHDTSHPVDKHNSLVDDRVKQFSKIDSFLNDENLGRPRIDNLSIQKIYNLGSSRENIQLPIHTMTCDPKTEAVVLPNEIRNCERKRNKLDVTDISKKLNIDNKCVKNICKKDDFRNQMKSDKDKVNNKCKINKGMINNDKVVLVKNAIPYSEETLQKVLHSPLPKGPPPKKPPRMFVCDKQNTMSSVISNNTTNNPVIMTSEKYSHDSYAVEEENSNTFCNNKCTSEKNKVTDTFNKSNILKENNTNYKGNMHCLKPIRSKTELEIMLKKIENASLKQHERFSPCLKSKMEHNKIYGDGSYGKIDELNKLVFKGWSTSEDYSNSMLCFKSFQLNSCIPESNIYAEPICSRSKFFIDTPNKNNEEHVYEDLNKIKASKIECNINCPNDGCLYYMSTPVDSFINADIPDMMVSNPSVNAVNENPIFQNKFDDVGNLKQNDTLCTIDGNSHDTLSDNKIQGWISDVYSKPWIKFSDSSSDSDSIPSTPEEIASPIIGKSISDDLQEQVVKERKGYVRRVATRAISRDFSGGKSQCKQIFESLILVGLDMDSSHTKVPYIKMKFPSDAQVPQRVEYLCFPDTHKWPIISAGVNDEDIEQCYTIILTTQSGLRKYGYCRRIIPEGASKPLPLAYCILSSHKANQFYFSILEELESRHGQTENDFTHFLKNLYNNEFPVRGHGIKVDSCVIYGFEKGENTEKAELFKRPLDTRLEDLQLAETLSYFRTNVFLQLFSSLLLERKVILLSSSISKLSTCIDGLQMALLPFNWQHTLISVVPSTVISIPDLCQAPTPYLIGLLKSSLENILPAFDTIHQVITVDIDENKILNRVGDENSILPYNLLKELKGALHNAYTRSSSINTYNLFACETFMKLFVELTGHYRHYVITSDHAKKKIFQKEAFIRGARQRSIRLFLEWFTETAMFNSFIESRLHVGPNSRGLFEQRCNKFNDEMNRFKHQKNNFKSTNKTIMKQIGDRIKDLTS